MSAIVLAIAFFGHALAAYLYAFVIRDEETARLVYFGSKVVVNAIPLVWVFGVRKERFRWPAVDLRGVAAGVVSGVVIGSVLVAFYYLVLRGSLDASGLIERAGRYGARDHFYLFAIFLCLGNSGMEEYYWRWFVFGRFKRFWSLPVAIVVSSIGFTLHHIVVLYAYFPDLWLVVLFNAGVFAGGCIWAWCYHRYRSIIAPYISHLIVDAAIMVVAYDLLF